MNKQEVYQFLQEKNIWFEVTEHKAVYNMEEVAEIEIPYPEADAKTLFIRDDKKKNYYLITVKGSKRVNLKEFRKQYQTRPLSFASEQELLEKLGLIAGSVTPLGIMNDQDKEVKVFFDNTIENLKNVYCYIYNGTEASVEWPGMKMQLDEETEYNGKKGYYSLEVPAAFLTGCFVINNGEAGSTLQGETVYVNGKVVTAIENTTITAVKKTTDDAWYSITGVRISKPAQPGLYIHNGKKVIIRK